MATRLIPGSNGTFKILFNNDNSKPAVPFQRGTVTAIIERGADTLPTGKVKFRDNIEIGSPVINYSLYSDYIDDATGLPFASLADLVAWCEANVFFFNVGGGGGLPGTLIKITSFTVGTGGTAPADGTTQYVDASMAAFTAPEVFVFKNGLGFVDNPAFYTLLPGGGIELQNGNVFSSDEVFTIFRITI